MNWQDEYPHVALCHQYAEDVLSGEQVACELIKKSCQRFMDDLARTDAPWTFDAAAAEKPCVYIESLPHIKGEWAKRRELLKLEPWQCFGICNLFGWLNIEDIYDDDGNIVSYAGARRFRTFYEEVARKNAKSTKAAAVGLYMLDADGESGAEIVSAATTRQQAKIVFGVAQEMARRTTTLPVEVRAHNINKLETASRFEALHAQGETLDGLNLHAAICDEIHAWKDRSVYDVLETATGSRRAPVMFNITTAGTDTGGICYDLRSYLVRILNGDIEDDSFFGVIYTLDKDDDWMDRSVWIKANPNLNVSVYPFDLEAQAKKAAEVPSQQNAFLTKRMNVWTNAAIAWMNMRKWDACYDASMSLDDFAGQPCHAGLDMASKIDINSEAQVFSREINGQEHIYAFMRHWLPEAAVKEDPHAQYDGWVRSGYIRTTPGNLIDCDRIVDDTMEEVVAPFRLQELGVDPGHNSTQVAVNISKQGVTVVDVRPTVLNFSEAMKWLEGYVKEGTFHHNCPVLTWMVSNVEVKEDFKSNIYPRKAGNRPNRKIDGVIALLIAINRFRAAESQYYPGEGLVIV